MTKEQSGVDFSKLLFSLQAELGVVRENVFNELEKQVWKNF